MNRRLVASCAPVEDATKRVVSSPLVVRDYTAAEQTAYDALQVATAAAKAADVAAARAKADDLATVRTALVWSSAVASALDRLLSSK